MSEADDIQEALISAARLVAKSGGQPTWFMVPSLEHAQAIFPGLPVHRERCAFVIDAKAGCDCGTGPTPEGYPVARFMETKP